MKERWPAIVSVAAAAVVGWLCFQKAKDNGEERSEFATLKPITSDRPPREVEEQPTDPVEIPQVRTNQLPGRPAEETQPTRITGPSRTGLVVLDKRIAIIGASLRDENPVDSVFHEAQFLDHTFPIILDEFYDVPGSPGSGVFFGKVEGHPHSSVKWAYHGKAESVEIRVHGEDTVKVEYAGNGREHRVFEWSSEALGKCSICLREK